MHKGGAGVEFGALEAVMIEELAPVGPLQTVPARRVAVAQDESRPKPPAYSPLSASR